MTQGKNPDSWRADNRPAADADFCSRPCDCWHTGWAHRIGQSDHLWTRLSGAPPRDVAGRYLQPENPELSKGTRSMSDANGSAHGCPRTPIRYVVLLFLLLLFLAWYIAIPRVHICFSNNGNGRLGFIMNSQHDIYRNDIHPRQATAGAGHIFPDEDFFMQFDWSNAGRHHCICINPKWPVTNVYIGPDGDVDWRPGSGTDVDRIWPFVYGENC